MGYSIYYDRAFIRVGDKYIPLVNSGASNCVDKHNFRLPEKDWGVLNWKRRDRVLFSESEIHDIAKDYERNHQENGMSFKSRSKPFAPGEFERWIVGGMKHAYSIDEYRSYGNRLFAVDYPNGMAERWREQPFSTDEELLGIIKQFDTGHEFHVMFGNNREVYRPARRRQEDQKRGAGQPESDKPSVMSRIAEARNAGKPAGRVNSAPGRKKSNDPEL